MLGAFQLAGTSAADAIDIQTVVVSVESVETSRVHECCKVGVSYLLDLAAVGTNQVGVGQGDAFILGLHAFKDVSAQHFGIHQQFHRVVHRGTAHMKTVTVDHLLQLFDSEVAVDAHDAVQDGITLGCPSQAMGIKIIIELAHNRVVAFSKIIDMWIGIH